ncbi:DUF4389 domain-containing protein [Anaeromyxobacter oryzae]|uniref:DUF4389 domain-containing protein n=1 Tax=Anaeromyxobacter oryzae TaxID=2918170 RepID=A0ABM7WU00_9BACT|nr:DUF4389 domain-containing protein [Anaeromyxobacter oryzae]BDG02938.1 hypothetical protein AMOR_19340 [Anaeromyxobacter oryzae]
METAFAGYPATLEIDYPDRELDRLTTALRLLTVIPIAIVLGLVMGPSGESGSRGHVLAAGGFVSAATALMLVFRRKYPRWWFDWNLALARFSTRVSAYLMLLRDEYPSTDEEQAVHLELRYPDAARELNRWLPLVKWLLAFPHYVALLFVGVAAIACVFAAWFAILFTGRYPRALFDFVVGAFRWGLRVAAYALLLTTDRYPPFTLSA